MEPVRHCGHCGSADARMKCSRCHVFYCVRLLYILPKLPLLTTSRQTPACQVANWRAHKPDCLTPSYQLAVADGPFTFYSTNVPNALLPPHHPVPSIECPLSRLVGYPVVLVGMPSDAANSDLTTTFERRLPGGLIETVEVSPCPLFVDVHPQLRFVGTVVYRTAHDEPRDEAASHSLVTNATCT